MKYAILLLTVLQILFFNVDSEAEYQRLIAPACLPVEFQAWAKFTIIFQVNDFYFVPENVSVLGAWFEPVDKELFLNVSSEVLNYGGTYFEYRFVQTLLKNAFNLPNVRYFTLLVEGEPAPLPESSKIYRALNPSYVEK